MQGPIGSGLCNALFFLGNVSNKFSIASCAGFREAVIHVLYLVELTGVSVARPILGRFYAGSYKGSI
jgi:hypothetical protein